ncbi:RING-H2 finger protein ATL20 isoform X1 [Arabidopsis lyrata subsp. lyrata]|uniref:RING-H2 finger protein ATL20 isoform X1 n=1 Tax=Arabidopsis lyrata subsp. lyrata TaxID=81972 RepID=UPI000A29CE35|nr:RING-H2 finger protein ATL20 isoform X1 [Arabidopsis lyrata subsp. lyrata]|eukprot:XP_020866877.1 RING-H2 finger protein ATL20 isoform X1 [Arabidopsis lyrata subsp. lyrata]
MYGCGSSCCFLGDSGCVSQFKSVMLFMPGSHSSEELGSDAGSYYRCGPLGVYIRFPFCGHPGFNLHCNNLNKTVLELPMSGTFLVDRIDYSKQQISISDPEDCMVKRLLTFNTSGSPFSNGLSTVYYTFLTCPNEVVRLSWYPRIRCLSNSTSTFFSTSNMSLANSMLPSCQIVKRLAVPVSVFYENVLTHEKGFSDWINYVNLLLEWSSPNCTGCEKKSLRCGFKNKASLEVKCFAYPPDETNDSLRVLIIILCSIGGITIFTTCIVMPICNSERFVFQRRQNAAIADTALTQQPRGDVVTTGLDQSTIESYKKVELGESRRLPGTNGIICPICLSEYASKETVRCMPECEHCFHVECIDAWLKIHNSCPVCRNSRS